MTYRLATLTRSAVDSLRSYWQGPWSSRDPALASLFGAGPTLAGTRVSEETALNLSSVWAAASIIAGDVASLPLITYERKSDGSRRRAPDHPLYRVLHTKANRETDAYRLRESLSLACLLWGNAYAEIVRDGRGRVAELWPLQPWRVQPYRPDASGRLGPLRYRIDGQTELDSTQVFHLRGLGHDPVIGLSVVQHARESLGLSMATEAFGATFFGNGATFGGVLTHPGKLTKDAKQSIRESIEDRHQGASRAHRLIVLDNGLAYQPLGVPPDDAQFLGVRLFQVQEVARWFCMPPVKLGDYSRATFSNAEQAQLEYFSNGLRRWLVRWESAIQMQLLSDGERDRYYSEHLANAILRADQRTRYESYKAGRDAGFLSVNDIRAWENLDLVSGGDVLLQPLNMTTIGGNRATNDDDPRFFKPQGLSAAVVTSHRDMMIDSLSRYIRRETERARRSQTTPAKLRQFAETYYDAMQVDLWTQFMKPALRAWHAIAGLDVDVDEVCATLAKAHMQESRRELLAVADLWPDEQFAEQLQRKMEQWERDRAARVIDRLIQFGVPVPGAPPPPTDEPAPPRGMKLSMLEKWHKTKLAMLDSKRTKP